jgi:DNA repair protein RecN (Recombination protein N)
MIESLHISNYALIDSLDIDFGDGFNTITGETGAGKSIMLGALSLLMGGRADTKVIRDATKKSVIEAVFAVESPDAINAYCADGDMEQSSDGRFILRRELSPSGRSRAFVNDSPVNLTQLQGLAIRLVDIHSQHQSQLLATPGYQLGIIDALAGNESDLADYRRAYEAYRRARKALVETREAIEKDRAEADYVAFQYGELDRMRLVPGEQEDLEHERDLLSNMTDIKMALHEAVESLTDGVHNALSLLDRASGCCQELDGVVDEDPSLSERLDQAIIEVRDIAETLVAADNRLSADPAQLESVEDRLNSIYDLQRKHRVDSVEKLIEIRDSLALRLKSVNDSAGTLAALKDEMERQRDRSMKLAGKVSDRRQEAARLFAAELKETALPLGMKNLQCEIAVRPVQMTMNGIDDVEFLFAFNKNQPLMPVGGSASGGEISRLMLSIKSIIARKMHLPSIIFDEVDTGVSGDVANRMGQMMADIASRIQVITITHLPQVAAKGSQHYKVYKEDSADSTNTRIRRLTDQERIGELALMLSGSADEATARANAQTLLNRK